MTTKKTSSKKTASKKTPSKRAATKKTASKKATTKKAASKKSTTKKAAPKKTAAKKTASKKATTKKTASKKATTKKAASKKTTTKKAASKKTTTKKTASKKTTTKKAASKKTTTKKTAPKKTAPKKTATKKTTTKKSAPKKTASQTTESSKSVETATTLWDQPDPVDGARAERPRDTTPAPPTKDRTEAPPTPKTATETPNASPGSQASGEDRHERGGDDRDDDGTPREGGRSRRRRRRRRRSGRNPDGSDQARDIAAEGGTEASIADGRESGGSGESRSDEEQAGEHARSSDGDADESDDRPRKRRRRRRRGRGRRGQGENPGGGDPSSDRGSPERGPEEAPAPESPPRRVTGILELPKGGDGRIRQLADRIVRTDSDPWVPGDVLDRAALRDAVHVEVDVVDRRPRRRGRGKNRSARPTVVEVISVEGGSAETWRNHSAFDELLPIDPQPRMTLEHRGCAPSCRLIDLFCPIGFGTRGLIVAPPKAGKTILLQNIAGGIKTNHPEVELIALLIDERPEEVTDFKRNVPAEVLASSNDLDVDAHTELGILAIERARRRLEAGKDVVVLLDSLTRLGRAFNNSRRYATGGRTMSGGLDSRALDIPKQLFGAARNVEGGGSLTIIATCLVDTGSRADQIIFEEFKGTGNMELILDRSIAEQRRFPAINLAASGTRKEDLLMGDQEFKTVTALRRRLLNMKPVMQIEQLLKALERVSTNEELVRG